MSVFSFATPKYKFLRKAVGNAPFRLLDVGSGNHSPTKTTALFPNCEYHGMDQTLDYGYSEADRAIMKGFYDNDLTKLDFTSLPDAYFDFIMMAHIIEHLHNGDEVITELSKKLKPGGHIYIEYPGAQSKKLPSMRGSLNFHDDKTHVRVYSVPELNALLSGNGFQVLSSGTRRSWPYVFATPARALQSLAKNGYIAGNVFWDLLGFAEYVYAQKER